MKARISKKRMVHGMAALCALCMLALPGCTSQTQVTIPVQAPAKPEFITCFGTVVWRESQPLRFPFDMHIQGIEARNGQIAAAQDILFYVDSDELVTERARLTNAVESLQFVKSGYESELKQIQSELAVCRRGVAEFDGHEMMDLLNAMAKNRNRTKRFAEDRLTLMETLSRYGLLEHYYELLGYATARDAFYYTEANPLLMQIEQSFDRKLLELQARADAKSAQIRQAESELRFARKQADALAALLSGQAYQNMKIAENGAVCLAGDGFLVDNINVVPHTAVRADEPILSIVHMDSLEVACYVEEQLVRDIQAGDKAQMALYSDSAVIELGTVAFVSQKAILRDGETVVEVVIAYEGDGFLPGYNVVAKITPTKSK